MREPAQSSHVRLARRSAVRATSLASWGDWIHAATPLHLRQWEGPCTAAAPVRHPLEMQLKEGLLVTMEMGEWS